MHRRDGVELFSPGDPHLVLAIGLRPLEYEHRAQHVIGRVRHRLISNHDDRPPLFVVLRPRHCGRLHIGAEHLISGIPLRVNHVPVADQRDLAVMRSALLPSSADRQTGHRQLAVEVGKRLFQRGHVDPVRGDEGVVLNKRIAGIVIDTFEHFAYTHRKDI